MPQYVTGPDGTVNVFPDEATPAQISEAMGLGTSAPAPAPAAPAGGLPGASVSAAPPQLGGWERYPVLAGQALARGLVRTAGLPGDLLAAAAVPQLSPEQQADVASVGGIAPTFPTTQQLTSILGPSGALGTSTTLPQPGVERFAAGALEGLGADLPFILTGSPEAIPLRAGIAGAGALAGEGAHEYAPNIPLAGPVAGALAGGGVQGARNLLAGDPFQRVAASLGGSSTLEDSGTALQQWAKQFRNPENPSGMNAQLESARGTLESALPYQTAVPTSALVSHAQELLDRGGKGAQAVRNFLSSTAKTGGIRGQAAQTVRDNLAPGLDELGLAPQPLPWGDSFGLRSELGAAYRGSRDPTERAALKYLYSGHTQDLGEAATRAGAGDEWNAFNKLSTDLHALDEGPVDDLLSAQPGSAANALINSGKKQGTMIQALRGAGAPVDELGASLLRTNPGGWKNLAPEAKEALVQDPRARALLESASIKRPSKLISHLHTLTGLTEGELLGAAAGHMLGVGPIEGGLYGGAGALGLNLASHLFPPAARFAFQPNMLGAEFLGGQAGRQEPEPQR